MGPLAKGAPHPGQVPTEAPSALSTTQGAPVGLIAAVGAVCLLALLVGLLWSSLLAPVLERRRERAKDRARAEHDARMEALHGTREEQLARIKARAAERRAQQAGTDGPSTTKETP